MIHYVLKKIVNNKFKNIAFFKDKEEAEKLKERLENIAINNSDWFYETDKKDHIDHSVLKGKNISYYKIECEGFNLLNSADDYVLEEQKDSKEKYKYLLINVYALRSEKDNNEFGLDMYSQRCEEIEHNYMIKRVTEQDISVFGEDVKRCLMYSDSIDVRYIKTFDELNKKVSKIVDEGQAHLILAISKRYHSKNIINLIDTQKMLYTKYDYVDYDDEEY